MQAGALQPYEWSLMTADRLGLHTEDGRVLSLDVHRWLAPADAADHTVLERCTSPTLDVGCGPGRFVAALNAAGIAALGLDIADTAVSLTRHRGVPAVLRSVFGQVPGEGRWPTVLLMDGNIGIGGAPEALLRRCAELVRPDGLVLVEVDPDDDLDDTAPIVLRSASRRSHPLPWARVGSRAVLRYALAADLLATEDWRADGRAFLTFRRCSTAVAATSLRAARG
jgi:SAM-dependent methyltransferase